MQIFVKTLTGELEDPPWLCVVHDELYSHVLSLLLLSTMIQLFFHCC
jgi:hypothetical protein